MIGRRGNGRHRHEHGRGKKRGRGKGKGPASRRPSTLYEADDECESHPIQRSKLTNFLIFRASLESFPQQCGDLEPCVRGFEFLGSCGLEKSNSVAAGLRQELHISTNALELSLLYPERPLTEGFDALRRTSSYCLGNDQSKILTQLWRLSQFCAGAARS